MPGLAGILNGDSDYSNFILLAVDRGSAAHILDYVREFLRYHEDGSKYLIHIVSFANDFRALQRKSNVILYDYLSKEYDGFARFYSDFCSNQNAAKNILILDDLKMFIEYNTKNFGRIIAFFKALGQMCVQTLGVTHTSTVNSRELEFFYNQSDAIATLTSQENDSKFLCNLIKVKSSGKVSSEQSTYEVMNGKLKETARKNFTGVDLDQNQKNMLTSLTTFKLTVEKDEEESKRQLYLPYFNAQNNVLQKPEEMQFDDEDEEDEEI